eukprot:Lithocolla_globosa_v1_NODE_181_length_5436_cov_36.573128.p4 type:complete len:181 gc:universal NODE_181_length_5436_cov_36.573128:1973-2515(+)
MGSQLDDGVLTHPQRATQQVRSDQFRCRHFVLGHCEIFPSTDWPKNCPRCTISFRKSRDLAKSNQAGLPPRAPCWRNRCFSKSELSNPKQKRNQHVQSVKSLPPSCAQLAIRSGTIQFNASKLTGQPMSSSVTNEQMQMSSSKPLPSQVNNAARWPQRKKPLNQCPLAASSHYKILSLWR